MELSYVFASPFTGICIDSGAPEGYADVDARLSRLMMSLWTDFAKYGCVTSVMIVQSLLSQTLDSTKVHSCLMSVWFCCENQ